jgi:hypothetical protein
MVELRDTCRWTPARLSRFFLLLLRGHWSSVENHEGGLREQFKCLNWNPDPDKSGLGIELTGKKSLYNGPHMIRAKVGNFRFQRSTIGNRSGMEQDNATTYRTLSGTAQLLIQHEAPDSLIASDMAFSTLCFLLGFTDTILDALGGDGQSFDPELLGEFDTARPDPKETFRVDVGCSIGLTLGVATTEESHRLALVSRNITPRIPDTQ